MGDLSGNSGVIAHTIQLALAPVFGDNPERVLKSADLALYSGKAAGRNCIRVFAPEMDEDVVSCPAVTTIR